MTRNHKIELLKGLSSGKTLLSAFSDTQRIEVFSTINSEDVFQSSFTGKQYSETQLTELLQRCKKRGEVLITVNV